MIDDLDLKEEFFVYVVLGSGEYVWIKIEIKLYIGKDGELIVEKMKLGWFIMLFG